ncbi:divalent-cation tolerance protein CutA [Stenotrophomonas sp. MMGLT7]|uniref:divalent-cation tolerance protein CutA n=1 Tax=Stenotrophomonas sp. MMGLT7 TaxID=2901227 RepID=UPI001E4DAD19|nr:divalent-cation tolerance protein CutA [Stenotrophomonas sp. MMGLT7]MCD7097887.1 divalent-cation tolerance protein CutA [Stenotrophomonas sp. MMGLT7]
MTPAPVFVVLCTCPDAGSADAIARALVESRLAACVTRIAGAVSSYRWQGEVEQAEEVQLLVKTAHAPLQAVIARLQELHPYELPEIVAVQADAGLPAYLDWVRAETSEEV